MDTLTPLGGRGFPRGLWEPEIRDSIPSLPGRAQTSATERAAHVSASRTEANRPALQVSVSPGRTGGCDAPCPALSTPSTYPLPALVFLLSWGWVITQLPEVPSHPQLLWGLCWASLGTCLSPSCVVSWLRVRPSSLQWPRCAQALPPPSFLFLSLFSFFGF